MSPTDHYYQTEHKKAEEALQKRESFLQRQQSALLELAKHTMRSNDFLAVLKGIAEAASQTLHIERIGIWLYNNDRTKITCLELYERNLNRHSSGYELLAKDFPHYFKALEEDRTVAADDALHDPRTIEFKESYLLPLGITSMLDAPIRVGGQIVGIVCHEHIGEKRFWELEEKNFAGSIADFVSLALEQRDLKKTEEALHEKSMAMGASMDGMAIHNNKGEFVYINQAHINVYGYDRPEDLIDKNWRILYDDRELKRFDREIMPLFWKQGKWRGEAFGKRRDGTIFPQEISLTATEDGGIVCVCRDITERKRVEEALRKNEMLLRTVFDAMPHWVFVKDAQSKMLLVNKKMATDYGLTPEEFVNVPTEETPLGNQDEKAFFVGVDQQVIATGESVDIPEEKITNAKGETHFLHTIKAPLKDAQGKIIGLVGVAEDISERKKNQEELDAYRKRLEDLVEERTRELRHSERLAATGRLAASIAHEINNPLQGITTHLEIIHDHLPVGFPKIKNYDFVKNNIEKIRGIVTKLLDTYRGSDENKIPLNINDIIDKVASLIEPQFAHKKIHLKLNLAEGIPFIHGWQQQLYQVFLNLILNAQDSIKEKGEVVVTTASHNGSITTSIADTGEGIRPGDMEHLFEPFFTTKAESGTGLGLFVSQGIIKEHGGIIKVKSEYGKGSVFTVVLPAKDPATKHEDK